MRANSEIRFRQQVVVQPSDVNQRQIRLNRRFSVWRVESTVFRRMLENVHIYVKGFLHIGDRTFYIQQQAISMGLSDAQAVRLGEGPDSRIIVLGWTKMLGEF